MTPLDRLFQAAARRHDFGTQRGKVRFVRTVAKHIGRIPDNTTRGHYLLKVVEMTGVDIITIRRQTAAK